MSNFTEAPPFLSNIYGSAPVVSDPIVIAVAPAQGVLKRGSVVSATGTLIALATDTPFGIVMDPEVDTTLPDPVATVDRRGSFKATELIGGGTLKVSEIADKLRAIGIFLEGASDVA
jgi:hypothetical protein